MAGVLCQRGGFRAYVLVLKKKKKKKKKWRSLLRKSGGSLVRYDPQPVDGTG